MRKRILVMVVILPALLLAQSKKTGYLGTHDVFSRRMGG